MDCRHLPRAMASLQVQCLQSQGRQPVPRWQCGRPTPGQRCSHPCLLEVRALCLSLRRAKPPWLLCQPLVLPFLWQTMQQQVKQQQQARAKWRNLQRQQPRRRDLQRLQHPRRLVPSPLCKSSVDNVHRVAAKCQGQLLTDMARARALAIQLESTKFASDLSEQIKNQAMKLEGIHAKMQKLLLEGSSDVAKFRQVMAEGNALAVEMQDLKKLANAMMVAIHPKAKAKAREEPRAKGAPPRGPEEPASTA